MTPEDPFRQSALTTILVVSNIEKSKKFYVDQLGASVYREYGGNSLVLNFLDHWLLLVTPGGPTIDKPGIHFEPTRQPNSVSHSFTIRVEDCEHSYQLLSSKGVHFITPPVVNGQETRCFFKDPDGHLFEISEYQTKK